MRNMQWTLQQLLSALAEGAQYLGDKSNLDHPVAGVSIDSRTIRSGEVFVAIEGDRFDGHDFVADVLAKDVAAAIVRRDWWRELAAKPENKNVIVVEDTLAALQQMAHGYRKHLNPQVFALTGTNGKTTTKEMIANVLGSCKATHKTDSNLNNHIGVPLTLLAMRPPVDVAVIEMGMNHIGEIATLCEIAAPDAGLITNIGRGHTEFVGGIDGVQRAKQELFDYLAPTGTLLVHADDARVVQAAHQAGVKNKITYGFSTDADVRGERMQLQDNGCATFYWQNHRIDVGIPGLHNATNALAAIAVGVLFGVPPERIRSALAKEAAISGRMRLLKIGGRTFIDDTYNANPESMQAALSFLVNLPNHGKRIAVLGDMLELGDLSHSAHTATLQFAVDQGLEAVLVFGPRMQAACADLNHTNVLSFGDKGDLTRHLSNISTKGDLILVKGSRGMKMEEVFGRINLI